MDLQDSNQSEESLYWILTDSGTFDCPKCGGSFMEPTKFCPDCGVRLVVSAYEDDSQ